MAALFSKRSLLRQVSRPWPHWSSLELRIDEQFASGRAREQLDGAVVVRRPEPA